jgi:tRNA(fMet)-specific endonuclease VapC
MYVLDTDHWTVLQLRTGPEYERLILRMDKVGRRNCFTTIVTFHEVMNGWLKYISSPKSQQLVVFAYTRFEELLRAFANSDLLPFSEKSADEFDRQRGLGCRIGTMDLRVASIAISHGMTVVTRNTVDFEKVSGLEFQDWMSG